MIVQYPEKRIATNDAPAFVQNNLLLDYISDAVIFTDLQLRVVYFNKKAEQIYDIHSTDIIGCPLSDVVTYQYINDSRENALRDLQETGNWQGKVIYTRKDARDVYLHAAVTYVRDANGEQVGVIATLKDITSEELIRQKARSYETNMQAILNNTLESLCLTDCDFNVIVFNRNAGKLIKGITGAELKEGLNLVDIVGESRKQSLLRKRELLLKGESLEYEVVYHGACSLVNIIPIRDQQGNTIKFCFTIRDITERKQSEVLLRIKEERCRTLVESLNEGVILQELDGRILTANTKAAEILGVSRDELIEQGFALHRNVLVDEYENVISPDSLLYEDESRSTLNKCRIIGLKNNNTIQWLQLTATFVCNAGNKDPYAIVVSFVDVTEEKKIRQEKDILSLLAMKTQNGIMIVDTEGRITWVNEGFTRINGYQLQEVIGKTPEMIFTGPETEARIIEQFMKAGRLALPFSGELVSYTRDGDRKWVQVYMQPVMDKTGKVICFSVIQTDITEQHHLEEEKLKNKIEQQKEINRVMIKTQENERSELGRELHDNINQILAVVKLQLEYALENYDEEKSTFEQCKKHIENVIMEIRHLSHRLVLPRFAETSLQAELQKMIHTIYQQQPVHLDIAKLQEHAIPVNIKETIYRIIQEQLNNIIKHAKAANARITLHNIDNNIVLQIEDDGQGFNLSQSRNGVGITNILNRVESYNGSAKIVSAPGKGCRLLISIPLKEQEY